jgi:hypothetical protein
MSTDSALETGPPTSPPPDEAWPSEAEEADSEGTLSDLRRLLAALLMTLAVIVTASWAMLHQWYGLIENRDNTHFAFLKIPGGFDSPIMRQTVLIMLVLAVCFAATILLLQGLRSMPWLATGALAAMVIAAMFVNVLLYPVGALDVFNYMIELKLAFHYDQNPYLVTFEAYRADSFALPAFLVNVTLFYGPAWLLVMWIPTAIAGFTDVIATLIALKIFNGILLGIAAVCIWMAQRDPRLRWVAVALLLANPLVLFEGVANAHNDVLLTVFVIGAMVALQRRSPLAGPLLALSALVKLYTVALAPIFIIVALRERWEWKRIAATVALTVLAVVATGAPYWGGGEMVQGLRAGLEESQQMDHVSPLSLARQYVQEQEAQQHRDPDFARSRPSFEIVPEATQDAIRAGFSIAFAVGALFLAGMVWKGRPPALAAAETLLLLFLLLTNLYPWYLIPAIALLALHPDRLSRAYVILGSGLAMIYYPMFVYGHVNSDWTRFQIHQFLALFLTVPILAYLGARVITWRQDHDPRRLENPEPKSQQAPETGKPVESMAPSLESIN